MDETTTPRDLPELATLTYKGSALRTNPLPSDVSGDDLQTFAPSPASTETEIEVPAPEAAYRLLRRVATGGMGEVWEAVQVSLGRVVAIKAVRRDRLYANPGAANQMTEEFRREAVFAARLEHPNILPVHDLGRDASGAPMLAMKYVQGTPWDRALERDLKEMSPAEILGRHVPVLIAVSQAVAFAHSRGIVHRDLKPAQVMLGEFGEVLLIDWGLAMFVGGEEQLEETRRLGIPMLEGGETATNPSGTPALMAPEQTHNTAMGIGTWTDVYLLGGTLYYLLTGTYPHEDSSVHRAFMRAHEGKIDPPSLRAPSREIPTDLEALALHALKAEPKERCASALDFIAALKDHLSGESKRRESRALAEQARSEFAGGGSTYASFNECSSRIEQAAGLWATNPLIGPLRRDVSTAHARLAVRNGDLVLARLQAERLDAGDGGAELVDEVAIAERAFQARAQTRRVAITASFVLLAMIVIGGAIFTRKLAASRDAEAEQRTAAEEQRALAERERDVARSARAKSDEFAQFVLGDMTTRLAPLERLDLLDPAMERAFEYYAAVADEVTTTDDRAAVADGLISVMAVSRARGNSPLQESAINEMAELLGQIPAEDSSKPEWTSRTIRLLQEKTLLFNRTGDATSAAETARVAIATIEAELKRDPNSLRLRGNLGESLSGLSTYVSDEGELDEALVLLNRAIAVDEEVAKDENAELEDFARLCMALRNRTVLLTRMNRTGEGEQMLERLYKVADDLSTRYPDNTDATITAALAFHAAGEWHATTGRSEDAERDHNRGISIVRAAIIRNPARPTLNNTLATSLNFLALLQSRLGKKEDSYSSFKEALSIGDALHERDPDNVIWSRGQVAVLNNAIIFLLGMSRPEEANELSAKHFALAIDTYEKHGTISDVARGYVVAHMRRASVLMSIGKADEALEVARQGVVNADKVAAQFPGDEPIQTDVIISRSWLSGGLYGVGRIQECVDILVEAQKVADAEVIRSPRKREAWEIVGTLQTNLGLYRGELGQSAESIESYRLAIEAFKKLRELDPKRVSTIALLAQGQQRLAESCLNFGLTEQGIAAARESLVTCSDGLAIDPTSTRLQFSRLNAALTLSRVLGDDAQETEAAEMNRIAFESVAAIEPRVSPHDNFTHREVGLSRDRVGMIALALDDPTKVKEYLLATRKTRLEVDSRTPNDRLLLAQLDDHIARTLMEEGRGSDAMAYSTSATMQMNVLRNEDESRKQFFDSEYAIALNTQTQVAAAAGLFDRAMESALEGEAIWESLRTQEPDNSRYSDSLARTMRTRGENLVLMGRNEEAAKVFAESLALLNVDEEHLSPREADTLLLGRSLLARALVRAGDLAGARTQLDAAAKYISPRGDSEVMRTYRDRYYWFSQALWLSESGDKAGARAIWEKIVAAHEPRPSRIMSPRSRAQQAIALFHLGRLDEARAIRDEIAGLDMAGTEILLLMPK